MHKAIALTLAVFGLVGCTTAGPFVMNVYKDGDSLMVKRCLIQANGLWGTISTKNCEYTAISATK
jgi:hypothetical protein